MYILTIAGKENDGAYSVTDDDGEQVLYLFEEEDDATRFAYQLEPTVTYTDKDTTSVNPEDHVKFTGTYDDYISQIKYFGGVVDNHDRLNKEKVYSWNPAVDYDKLVNYREYYWLPEGPNAIEIDGPGTEAEAEYKVEIWPDDGSSAKAYNFPHRENERNPILTLYRGNTYKFNVNAKGHPFYIMTEPYPDGSSDLFYSSGVTNNGAQEGTVTFLSLIHISSPRDLSTSRMPSSA